MIVYAEKIKSIIIEKVHTDDNLANITTKPLTGATFRKHRDAILGTPSTARPLSFLPCNCISPPLA